MKSFTNETFFFVQKVLGLLKFVSYKNCVNSVNFIAEIQCNFLNERVLALKNHIWIDR